MPMTQHRALPRAASLSLLAALLSLVWAPATGAQPTATLSRDGHLYQAVVDSYATLFPAGSALPSTARVIALDIQSPQGDRERLLVPESETLAPEGAPYVHYEDASGRLFMVWEGLSRIHSSVNLVSWDGAAWSDVLKISGNPFTMKSAPRLAVTRERYVQGEGAAATEVERTVLHTVWYEDDYGTVDVLYSPVTLENGVLPELLPPIFKLGSFVAAPDAASGARPTYDLLRSPRALSISPEAALVGFVDAATEQLVTVRLDVLPAELSALADELDRFLREQDSCSLPRQELAERARAHLVVIGGRFSAFARQFMADSLRDWLLAHSDEECAGAGGGVLAGRARAHLVVIGRRALREVIASAAETKSYTLTIGGGDGLRQDIALSVLHTRTLPPALTDGQARIHVGGSGKTALVSWLVRDSLVYQEHDGNGWLPALSLTLGVSLTLEDAYSVLDARAQ